MARSVLVTGGAGFVGSHLVDRLVASGARTSVVDTLARGRRSWLPGEAELYEIDIRDEAGLERAVSESGPEAVVHLAAMHFIPAVDGAPKLAWDVNVNGTRALLDTLARRPPKLLLFASTAAVYPDRRGPIDETCAPDPLDLYGRTKLAGEELVADFAARFGTRVVCVRIFNVIGRRETNPHVVPEIVGQLQDESESLRLGNLETRRDYTDVMDVAAALHLLLESPLGGRTIFNLGSGCSVSVLELVRLCEKLLGRAIAIEVEPAKLRTTDRAELVADATVLRHTTGWEPARSLAETVEELLTDQQAR
jgi:UDP-glucose 4-epimerase